MLATTTGRMISIDGDYCIQKKYNGINELHFKLSDGEFLDNEQPIFETTERQRYLVKVINGQDIICDIDLDDLRSTQTDYSASATPSGHLSDALEGVGWSLVDYTGITTRRTIEGSLTPLEIIEQVEETWDGVTAEYDTGTQTVTILCPEDNDPQFAFLSEELNLRKLDIACDSSSFCTRLRAKGADGMTFASINDGKDYVENYTYSDRIIYGTAIKDERFTDAQSLLDYAQATLDANAVPGVSYECDVIDVAAIDADYSFNKLQLHKSIWLLDKDRNRKVAHRVVEYHVYPDNPAKNKVTLSTVSPSIQGSLKWMQNALTDPNSAVRRRETSAVENATKYITGAKGGNIRFVYDGNGKPIELLCMDTDDIATAQKVWRFNIGGFGYSSNGYNGTYATAITQDGHIVADFMDVGTLSAVLIQSADGKSKWNLSTGDMDLYNTKISTSAQGATYTSTDYTEADHTRVRDILLGKITPTLADYEKYDINGTGTLSLTDLVNISAITNGTKDVNFTTSWNLKLDPADGESLLKVYRIFHDNLTNEETESIVFSAGFSNVKVNSLEAANGVFVENVTAGNNVVAGGHVDATDYYLDGNPAYFATKGLIGYVVSCLGTGTVNKANCFIPYGADGTYQCASNDWYCSFEFDTSIGKATKTGGTGTINTITSVVNYRKEAEES